jgi:hypothetical protein
MNMLKRLWKNDRGDLLVTPAVILFGIAATFVLGGLAYFGAKTVTPKVQESRQGVTIDDQGNIVMGAVGVIPMKTAKPKPEETPEPAPKVITKTRIIERDPEPAPQPQPEVIVVNPGNDGYTSPGNGGHVDEGSSNTSNSGDGGHDEPHHEDPHHDD